MPGRPSAPAPAEIGGLPGAYPTASACEVTAKLIPSCGAWWGIAPEVFTGRRPEQALKRAEKRMGAPGRHRARLPPGQELFPTAEESGDRP